MLQKEYLFSLGFTSFAIMAMRLPIFKIGHSLEIIDNNVTKKDLLLSLLILLLSIMLFLLDKTVLNKLLL